MPNSNNTSSEKPQNVYALELSPTRIWALWYCGLELPPHTGMGDFVIGNRVLY